ncbi:MAG TPA: multiheme c-type cytochrome [Ignavibacteria bacterium]
MRTKIFVPLIGILFISFILFSAFTNSDDPVAKTGTFKYVGVDKCAGACHKGDTKGKQLEIWQDSKHSQAYKNLQTPEADKIAKDRGFTTPAAETPQCLKCHVLGKDIDPAELEDTFDKTQGIQCETCHGPGSEYKKLSIMKDKEQAKQNGLTINNNEEFCKTCHNSESPNYKEFKYDEFWAKIQHSKPKD